MLASVLLALAACGGGGDGGTTTDTSVSTPSGVTATATSDTTLTVSWTSQPNARSYVVYDSTTSPVTKSAHKTVVDSFYSKINFSGGAGATKYYFAVSASKSSDGSSDTALSTEVSATTPPSTPTIIVDPQSGQALVSWIAASGTSYKIYHSDSSTFTNSNGLATVVTSSSSPVTVTGLTNGQLRYFAASATYNGVESALSAIQAVVPGPALGAGVAPPAPQRFVADCFLSSYPSFSWAKQAGAGAYRIHYSTANPVTLSNAYFDITSNVNRYSTITSGVTLSGKNYFAITALNGSAESPLSTQTSCP